jgi:hypothetical protein
MASKAVGGERWTCAGFSCTANLPILAGNRDDVLGPDRATMMPPKSINEMYKLSRVVSRSPHDVCDEVNPA